MKGQRGICTATENGNLVRRTRFTSKEHAQLTLNTLLNVGAVSFDNVVYQCKICGDWHTGKPEWAKQFGK